jgi:hypothetical protein
MSGEACREGDIAEAALVEPRRLTCKSNKLSSSHGRFSPVRDSMGGFSPWMMDTVCSLRQTLQSSFVVSVMTSLRLSAHD